jgi:hypothetical protein
MRSISYFICGIADSNSLSIPCANVACTMLKHVTIVVYKCSCSQFPFLSPVVPALIFPTWPSKCPVNFISRGERYVARSPW